MEGGCVSKHPSWGGRKDMELPVLQYFPLGVLWVECVSLLPKIEPV